MQHVTQSGVDCSRLRHVMSCDVFGGGGPRGAWWSAYSLAVSSGLLFCERKRKRNQERAYSSSYFCLFCPRARAYYSGCTQTTTDMSFNCSGQGHAQVQSRLSPPTARKPTYAYPWPQLPFSPAAQGFSLFSPRSEPSWQRHISNQP